MNLSPHFTLSEMTASQIAARAGLANEPSLAAIENMKRLCVLILEPLRARVGPIYINSGYRALMVNRLLGSKDTSHHVQGRAADIRVMGMRPLEVCQMIVHLNLPFEQVIHEFGGWCHVSIPVEGFPGARTQLTIDSQGTRVGLLEIRK